MLNDADAAGLYLTMYGYIPNPANGDKIPNNLLFQEPWTHGRWTPSAMDGPKTNLYLAQGMGSITYDGQMNTNVYFAGNNTTVDLEEGALISAMAIANYAFGVDYPLIELSPESFFAFTMYNIYHDVMFPKQNASHAIAAMYQSLPQRAVFTKSAAALMASPQVKTAPTPAKRTTNTKKKAVAKKTDLTREERRKEKRGEQIDQDRQEDNQESAQPQTCDEEESGKESQEEIEFRKVPS